MTVAYAIDYREPPGPWRLWEAWPDLAIDGCDIRDEVAVMRRLWPGREWRVREIRKGENQCASDDSR